MLSEADVREIRKVAIQAAATCAVTVQLGEPAGMIKVAHLMETYIMAGTPEALKLIESWSAPAPAEAAPAPVENASPRPARDDRMADSPTLSRAQELANAAYMVTRRSDLQSLANKAKEEEVMGDEVTVDGIRGTLRDYFNNIWESLPGGNPELGL